MKTERLFAAFLLAAALGLLYLALGYTAPVAYDPLGPRPYPVLVLSLLAACCLYLAVRPRGGHTDLGYTPAILKKTGLCIVFLAAYAALFEVLGFPLATALASFGIGRLFGGKTLPCALAGIALGALFYVLFDLLLDVPLPLGFFG